MNHIFQPQTILACTDMGTLAETKGWHGKHTVLAETEAVGLERLARAWPRGATANGCLWTNN